MVEGGHSLQLNGESQIGIGFDATRVMLDVLLGRMPDQRPLVALHVVVDVHLPQQPKTNTIQLQVDALTMLHSDHHFPLHLRITIR